MARYAAEIMVELVDQEWGHDGEPLIMSIRCYVDNPDDPRQSITVEALRHAADIVEGSLRFMI